MQTRRLGRNGPEVSAIGFGCMGLSPIYGAPDDAEGIATIHAAIDAGITLFDTGDFYGLGHNEELVRRALAGKRDKAFIQVKFGALRAPNGAFVGFDARPASVKNFLTYSLRRLGTDYIDLYMPARLDPTVPIEDTVGAIADMIKAGYVRHLGLSEVGIATIKRANAVHPVRSLQIEYSLMSRGIEAEILPGLRELGISATVYGVLSRGLIGGHITTPPTDPKDGRRHYPRFSAENLGRNLKLVEALAKIASEHNATPAMTAMAWAFARGTDIIPLIGMRHRKHLADAIDATELKLSPEDIKRIEAAVPPEAVAGTRYSEANMRGLDSESAI